MQKATWMLFILLLFITLTPQSPACAQTVRQENNDIQSKFKTALDLYHAKHFLAAHQLLIDINSNDLPENLVGDVEFYTLMSSLKLEAKDAFLLADKFKKEHKTYSQMVKLDFLLADYYFEHTNFKKAIFYYESIVPSRLEKSEIARFYYRLGYCYFIDNNPEKAKINLHKVKDIKSKYAISANYYYAHIAYQQKDYTTALQTFYDIQESPQFKDIIPYYIVQIAFRQKQYDYVARIAPELYGNVSVKRRSEIAQILGVSLYLIEDYAKAIEYLEYYRQAVGGEFSREDYYQLAFSYLKNEEYQQAVRYFEKVEIQEDALSQNAYYNIGAAYLQMGQKQFAGEAFYQAYQLQFDKSVKEDAMFNFAKVSYELSNDPYNKAIKALLEFMTKYPDSDRIADANEYLVNLFLSAKNYKGAFEEIERIPNKNNQLLAAYQKITYQRGLELFREGDYKQALELLKKSTRYNFDKLTKLHAQYWLAETYYQLQDYEMSIRNLEELKRNGFSRQMTNFNRINYTLAYAYFLQEDYEKAMSLYQEYIKHAKVGEARLLDSYLRVADIYFIAKDFNKAIANYQIAERISPNYLPYAVYQKAQASGGNGNLAEKIRVLKAFTQTKRDFELSDDAFAELGVTYLLTGKEAEAIETFTALMNRFPNSPFYRTALLKTGLAHYNLDHRNEALVNLKLLVAKFPGTQESKEALVSIRNIYVESNTAEEFFTYVNGLPNGNVTSSEQDTIMYRATENVYMNGDCKSAIPGFSNYILKFPEGAFITSAHYYRAECFVKTKQLIQAVGDYNFVLEQPNTLFHESALSKVAIIYRNQKNYDEALLTYNQLYIIASSDKNRMIAREGQLESFHQLNKYDSTILVAQQILRSPDADEKSYKQAHLYLARAAIITNQYALAQKEYKIVEALFGGNESAEAKYYLAVIQYQKGEYKLAEEEVFKLISDYGSYDYWVAKGFILLADIYVKYGNTFQAKHTLQSIIDNQSDTALIHIAKQKKQAVVELEYLEELEKKKDSATYDSSKINRNINQYDK